MKRAVLTLLTLAIFGAINAQVSYEEITSIKLNTTRQLKIKLPKDYDASSSLKHPLIIVFDGDYLFEPVVGQVNFQTYFDDMPGSIIVGIVQGNERFYDGYTDAVSGLPIESGARFFEFISKELIPYLDNKYNTSDFRVAVGHNTMGNFINSYLFKDKPVFQAYVNLSPDFNADMSHNIAERFKWLKEDIFYYMATSDNDISDIREMVLQTNENIKNIENPKLTYYFDEFQGDSHYTLVTSAVSKAFDKIFEIYKPLREKELNEKVLLYKGTLDKYLEDRYKRIEELFGIVKLIPEEEFEKVVKVAEERNDLESLEKLGKLAKKQNPESLLGTYYLAQYAEKIGKTKKAKKLYESALTLNDVSYINREFILSRVEELTVVENDDKDEETEEEN